MSQYSELSDLLHLALISRAPDSGWPCRRACSSPLTSGSVGRQRQCWRHTAIWNLCLRGSRCCIRNPSYHCGRKCTLWRPREEPAGYFVPPLFLTSVPSTLTYTYESTSLPLKFLFPSPLVSSRQHGRQPPHLLLCWTSTLLHLFFPPLLVLHTCLTFALLAWSLGFSTSALFHFFPPSFSYAIVNTKHIIAPCGPMIC